jgi:hypothetical protein
MKRRGCSQELLAENHIAPFKISQGMGVTPISEREREREREREGERERGLFEK